MSQTNVTFIAEDGTTLKLWQVRAGMLIRETEYRHDPQELVLTVGHDRRKARSERSA
jgi:hypothetical protein